MNEPAIQQLSTEDMAHLRRQGWGRYVGDGPGIWVSAARQQLLLIRHSEVLRLYPCSTAAAGLGNRSGSLRTPPGWHQVAEKVGHGLPAGAILKSRVWTGEIWRPGDDTEADMILSRILRLAGLEEGRNLGGQVDTHRRMIYIHGTNAEDLLGRPASHGCVRLSNQDVIELFDIVDCGCRVLITRR